MTTTFRADVLRHYRERRAEGHRPKNALALAKFDARYGRESHRASRFVSRHCRDFPTWSGDSERADLPNGWYITSRIEYDEFMDPPWEAHDGHGVVSNWEHGERDTSRWVLCSDRNSYRYYDWRESLKIAKRDGWGPGETMDAVRADYEHLAGWCNDRWHWVGLIFELYDENETLLAEESCWGFESTDTPYLVEQMRSWAATMICGRRQEAQAQRHAERVAARFEDAMENAL